MADKEIKGKRDDVSASEKDDVPKKKFGWGEIVLVSLIVGLTDLFTLIATLSLAIPVVGEVMDALASFASVVVTGGLQFYLSMKKVKNLSVLIGGVLDTIPIINALPTLTAGWIILVIMENNPKIKKVAEKAEKTPAGKIAGRV